MTADSPARCNIVGGHRPPLQSYGREVLDCGEGSRVMSAKFITLAGVPIVLSPTLIILVSFPVVLSPTLVTLAGVPIVLSATLITLASVSIVLSPTLMTLASLPVVFVRKVDNFGEPSNSFVRRRPGLSPSSPQLSRPPLRLKKAQKEMKMMMKRNPLPKDAGE